MPSCRPTPPRATGGRLLAPLLALALAASPDAGLHRAALDALVRGAEQSHSDGIAVAVDGELVLDRAWSRSPTNTQSVTKLFTGLAIQLLVADGKIASLDAPLATWVPDWRGTPKEKITVREVLEHRSGLAEPSRYRDLLDAPDAASFAEKLPLVDAPGTRRRYGNAAVALLARVIRVAAGTSEDELLDARVFKPLGISDWKWPRDVAGNPHAFEGLALSAADLARVGAWLVNREPPPLSDVLTLEGEPLWMSAGANGNLLVVFPERGVAVARVRSAHARDTFEELVALSLKLARARPRRPAAPR